MTIVRKLRDALRRRPLTPEQIEARAEAKRLQAQMLDDRLSQESRAGQVFRSQR